MSIEPRNGVPSVSAEVVRVEMAAEHAKFVIKIARGDG